MVSDPLQSQWTPVALCDACEWLPLWRCSSLRCSPLATLWFVSWQVSCVLLVKRVRKQHWQALPFWHISESLVSCLSCQCRSKLLNAFLNFAPWCFNTISWSLIYEVSLILLFLFVYVTLLVVSQSSANQISHLYLNNRYNIHHQTACKTQSNPKALVNSSVLPFLLSKDCFTAVTKVGCRWEKQRLYFCLTAENTNKEHKHCVACQEKKCILTSYMSTSH